jgi:hypothetical protein
MGLDSPLSPLSPAKFERESNFSDFNTDKTYSRVFIIDICIKKENTCLFKGFGKVGFSLLLFFFAGESGETGERLKGKAFQFPSFLDPTGEIGESA